MQQLQVFNFESNQVRTVLKDGELWFVAADVCQVLNIGNPSMAVARLEEDEVTLSQIEGSHRATNIINESGLYSLILRSDKPEAKRFKKWVTSEVLPSIRKTGSYGNQVAALNDPVIMRGLLLTYSEKLLELQPKADALDRLCGADGMVCFRDAAKALKLQQNKLINWLLLNGWLYRDQKGKLRGYSSKTPRYIIHKITPIPTDGDEERVSLQAMVTAECLAKLSEIFNVEVSRAA